MALEAYVVICSVLFVPGWWVNPEQAGAHCHSLFGGKVEFSTLPCIVADTQSEPCQRICVHITSA